jgi:hypothetical protein
MEFLMILLLIVGVSVAMGAGVVGFSYALGRFFYNREAGWPVAPPSEACARCHADAEWYGSLPAWKQTAIAGWWWTNRVICAARGCR